MATFRVGDRVRITKAGRYEPVTRPAGSVGTITELNASTAPELESAYGAHHRVMVDGIRSRHPQGFEVPVCYLAPLTPPAEDAWAADKVKELTRPKPMDVEREPVRVPEGDKLPTLREVLRYYRGLE
jgi:hypothetical protein